MGRFRACNKGEGCRIVRARNFRQGSSEVEQGTHKPLVGSSILPPGTHFSSLADPDLGPLDSCLQSVKTASLGAMGLHRGTLWSLSCGLVALRSCFLRVCSFGAGM